MNMQTENYIPDWEALERFQLPSLRKMFRPDPGKIICDIDLAGADAQVVAWDAGDEKLKAAFRAFAAGKGPKIHVANAKTIFGELAGDGKREPYYTYAKMGVHATNYGAKPPTLARALNISQPAAKRFQDTWFREHPEILEWQHNTMQKLMTTRSVQNAFGFRKFYFDRIDDSLLGQALAWVPQSTVAITVNKAWEAISNALGNEVDFLLQVHDSLVFQILESRAALLLPEIKRYSQIVIPYDDPLIIPFGLKVSNKSWGDAVDTKW